MAVVGKGSEKSWWEMPELSIHFRPLVLLRSEVTQLLLKLHRLHRKINKCYGWN